jgi:hypothetical protein
LKYCNEHNFVILTNDFRRYIVNKKHLELIVNVKNDGDYVDFIDVDKIFSYIESKINTAFTDQNFHSFIRDLDSFESLKVLSIIKKI